MSTIGQRLRDERESRGVAIETLARRVGVDKARLEAIERDDFQALIDEDSVVRACLRGYARYLSTDADALIRDYFVERERCLAELDAAVDSAPEASGEPVAPVDADALAAGGDPGIGSGSRLEVDRLEGDLDMTVPAPRDTAEDRRDDAQDVGAETIAVSHPAAAEDRGPAPGAPAYGDAHGSDAPVRHEDTPRRESRFIGTVDDGAPYVRADADPSAARAHRGGSGLPIRSAAFVVVIAIVAAGAWWMLSDRTGTSDPATETTATNASGSTGSGAPSTTPSTSSTGVETPQPAAPTAAAPETPARVDTPTTTTPSSTATPPVRTSRDATATTTAPEPVARDRATTAPATPSRTAAAAASSGMTVSEYGLGTGVRNRALVGEGTRFDEGERIYFLTRVLGGEAGGSVDHVWMRNGVEMARIPLDVGGPSWRTYSSKTIHAGTGGAWAVEVRDASDRTLARAEFTAD